MGDRVRDITLWPRNLVRDLPLRARRLPVARAEESLRAQSVALAAYLWDLAGGPELFSALWRLATRTSALSMEELEHVADVLGPEAIRYRDVRVAQGGLLSPIFRLNGGRAFTAFHTVNLPAHEASRTLRGLLVHELVHVLQHEKLGSVYIPQCLRAQRAEGYDYGGTEGLCTARAEGKRLCDFNREQQAQIAEDYFNARAAGAEVTAYEPYIEELKRGEI